MAAFEEVSLQSEASDVEIPRTRAPGWSHVKVALLVVGLCLGAAALVTLCSFGSASPSLSKSFDPQELQYLEEEYEDLEFEYSEREDSEDGITVTIQWASNLPDTDAIGNMDPYVICKLEDEDQFFQTETLDDAGSDPDWGEEGAQGWLSHWHRGESILCTIWDEDYGFLPDDEVGTFRLPASILNAVADDEDEDEDEDEEQSAPISWEVPVTVATEEHTWPFRLGSANRSSGVEKSLQKPLNSSEDTSRSVFRKLLAKDKPLVKGTVQKGAPRPTCGDATRCDAHNTFLRRCQECTAYEPCWKCTDTPRNGKTFRRCTATPFEKTFKDGPFGQVKVCKAKVGKKVYQADEQQWRSQLVVPLEVLRGVEDIKLGAPRRQEGLWKWADTKCKMQAGTNPRNCVLLLNPNGHRRKSVLQIHAMPAPQRARATCDQRNPNSKSPGALSCLRDALRPKFCRAGKWTRSDFNLFPDLTLTSKTASKKKNQQCKAWAKPIKEDLSTGVFAEAFKGEPGSKLLIPPRPRTLQGYGLLVFWMDCGNGKTARKTWKRFLLLTDDGCSLQRSVKNGAWLKAENFRR